MSDADGRKHPAGAGRRALGIAWKIAAVGLAIAVIAWAHNIATGDERILAAIERFGYPGVFLLGVVSGFNVVVPVPAISFLPVMTAAGLDAVVCVLVISAGMTLGDMLGFALGRAGRRLVERPGWLRKLEAMRERHWLAPYVLLFFYAAFAPLPNELIVIPIALMGCTWYGVFAAALGGNLLFNTMLAIGFEGIFGLF